VALLAYPLVIEPVFALGAQSRAWTGGFLLLGFVIAVAAAVSSAGEAEALQSKADEKAVAPSWSARLSWIALAAVPSGLLVSVTAHISTDVASAPLLWVVPLAMFLATFVLVFRERPVVSATTLSRLQILFVGLAAGQWAAGLDSLWFTLPIHLGLFFVTAMACHDALYARRPSAERLTEFYMLMSLGGVIGGVFCGLLAPQIFSSVIEYPLFVIAGLFCSAPALAAFAKGAPAERIAVPQGRLGLYSIAALAVAFAVVSYVAPQAGAPAGLAAAVMFALLARAPRLAAFLAVVAGVGAFFYSLVSQTQETHRSFFGVHKVREVGNTQAGEQRYRVLMHGVTVHGAQRIADAQGRPVEGEPQPLTYYTDGGPLAESLRAVRGALGGRIARASLVGLGSGSLACQMRRDEDFAFYEIDPVVAQLASDPKKFGFLDACAKGKPIVLGDARLTLEKAKPGANVLVLDAFSSDAIPAHLLTKEAFASYLKHIDQNGVIVAHISNKYFNLSRILARTGAELGLTTWLRFDDASHSDFASTFRASSLVAVLARNPADVGVIASANDGRWRKLEPAADVAPWTDDYSNMLQAVSDKLTEK
jgi:hypothetical protein